jgi:hypothetical protein
VARAEELLSLVGLTGFEGKRPSELSGGMRQRASLCRAIVHKPEVLIMDEPFGALDAFTREDLWQTMRDLRAQEPFTCVLITHDLRESVFLGDQVIVLSGRPATTQYVLDVNLPADRTIDDLYTPEQPRCCTSCATRSRSRRAAPPGVHRTDAGRSPFRPPSWPFWRSGNGWSGSTAGRTTRWPRLRPAARLLAVLALFFEMGWQTLWRTVAGLARGGCSARFWAWRWAFPRIARCALPAAGGLQRHPQGHAGAGHRADLHRPA